MAKSIVQQLQEAIEGKEYDLAEQLAQRLANMGKKGKPKAKAIEKAPSKPAKATKTKAATTTKAKPKKATKSRTAAPKKRQDVAVHDLDESSYIAPSRTNSDADDFGGRKFIGPDGKEHTYAKRVSMEGVKFVNKFKPDEYTKLPAKHASVDKKLKNLKISPRPGQRGAQRDVAKKVEARCVICRNVVKVYPWEADTVDGESNFRCSKRSCVKAR